MPQFTYIFWDANVDKSAFSFWNSPGGHQNGPSRIEAGGR
jgi:hypothetical protein